MGSGEPFDSEGGGGEGLRGEEEGERVDCQLGFTLAEVGEPDEAVGEGMGGVGWAVGGADDGDAFAALAEEGAGVVGGEGVLEIEIGGEVEEAPGGELFAEDGAELFAEVVAFGLFAEVLGGRFGFVVEDEGAEFAAELFDRQGEAAGFFFGDGNGAAVELAGVVPGGDEEGGGFFGELELACLQGEGEFAGFLEDRLAGGGEKGFDRCVDAGGVAARGPLGGSCHYPDYRMDLDGFTGSVGHSSGADRAGGAAGGA